MRLLDVFRVELVVQIYEVVIEIVVEIIILVIVEVVVVKLLIVHAVRFVLPLVLDTILVIVLQIVLEILVLGVTFGCLLRPPRFSFPVVRETPGGLQHGAHYRNLLVVRPKRARASPRVTTSFYRSR